MQFIQKKSSSALVVMLKAPVAGKVKTRLASPLSPKDAARLYKCFIQDTFSRINVLKGIDIIAAYTPKGMAARAKKIAPPGIAIIPQKGRDLGERLQNIFYQLFSIGYKKIAIIGTDSPDLPMEYIEKAFLLLKGKTELVLGPAEDGGYYLVAMSKESKEIFKDIPWSTSIVFKKTMEKAKRVGLKTAILPKWYDVDEINDLQLLSNNLKTSCAATKTSKLLEKIFKKLPVKKPTLTKTL